MLYVGNCNCFKQILNNQYIKGSQFDGRILNNWEKRISIAIVLKKF